MGLRDYLPSFIRKEDDKPPVSFQNIGSTGLSRWAGTVSEEFLTELRGPKGQRVYEEMSKNDPVIGASLFVMKLLIKQTEWKVVPGSDSESDHKAAKFLDECLDDLDHTWDAFLDEVLTMLEYGWCFLEVNYKRRQGPEPPEDTDSPYPSKYDDNLIGWRSFEIRAQDTLSRWDFDEHGNVRGMFQLAPPDYEERYIPEGKAIHFRTKKYKNNPQGESVLRRAYRPWYFKKNIEEVEAIGIERDLAGLPTAQPEEPLDVFNTQDPEMINLRNEMEDMLKNIRVDSQAGLLIPYGWKVELLSSAGSKQIDTTKVIDRYDQRIAATILTDFILLGSKNVGSYALNVSKQSLFQKALEAWTGSIASTFNRQAVERLFKINDIKCDNLPGIKAAKIEAPPVEEIAKLIKAMSQAGAELFPDRNLENHLREKMDLPSVEEAKS